jgi:hypothetical protein
MSKEKYLTIKEFSDKHRIARSTVSLWCRNGTLKGAYQEQTPFGEVWYIPESTSNEFEKPKRGRPLKVKNLGE